MPQTLGTGVSLWPRPQKNGNAPRENELRDSLLVFTSYFDDDLEVAQILNHFRVPDVHF